MPDAKRFDCLVIGGGPAGLTAAMYLARFRRSVLVADRGGSRATKIPRTFNYPGLTGVSGTELLGRLGEAAAGFGARLLRTEIRTLARENGEFVATSEDGCFRALYVVLASGLKDVEPALDGFAEVSHSSAIRYCPICDGFEMQGKRVGVLGHSEHARREAQFLRTFSNDVILVPTGPSISDEPSEAGGFDIATGAATRIEEMPGGSLRLTLADGTSVEVDVLYPALGCEVRSELAAALGAQTQPEGCLIVDSRQQTSVPGLYAAGDVVSDLNQIVVAEGHAAIAATAIHRRLPPNPS